MTVLRTLSYFEFDFLLNFTLEKSYETNVYQNVHKNNNYFIMFFVVAKLGEISGACNFFSTV